MKLKSNGFWSQHDWNKGRDYFDILVTMRSPHEAQKQRFLELTGWDKVKIFL